MRKDIYIRTLKLGKLYGMENCNIYYVYCRDTLSIVRYEANARKILLIPITMYEYLKHKKQEGKK